MLDDNQTVVLASTFAVFVCILGVLSVVVLLG